MIIVLVIVVLVVVVVRLKDANVNIQRDDKQARGEAIIMTKLI